MNEEDKLIMRYLPSLFIDHGTPEMRRESTRKETVNLCRKNDQMEKDIKSFCNMCICQRNKSWCDDGCQFRKYGYWKDKAEVKG